MTEDLDRRIQALHDAVAGIVELDWTDLGIPALETAADALERASRSLHAVGCTVSAESARRHLRAGRSQGSAATALGAALGLPAGEVHRRIEAGRRTGSAAMSAHKAGRITAHQEQAVAQWVAELPESTPSDARDSFAEHLTVLAESGTGTRRLGALAQEELCRLDPGWQDRREARQAKRRAVRTSEPDADGVSLVAVACDAPMRALIDAVLARYGGPGQCLSPRVDPQTGETADLDSLAADDRRTPEQRAHDALRHVLQLGLNSAAGSRTGVASIVVRVTAEQLDEIECRGTSGGIVTTDSGTEMSARQALGMSAGRSWFISALRDGREELHRIDIDRNPRKRLASRIQRLVLYAAHGGCTHPGCTSPAARCQAHHVREHQRGGPTTVANLTLACPVHHGWIGSSPGQWRTVADPRRPGMPRWIPPGRHPTSTAA